ncbi:MAG: fimbrillin family protein, partial [Rikenellaceae bacterium]
MLLSSIFGRGDLLLAKLELLLYIGIAIAAIGCTKDPDIDQSVDTALTITSNIATRVTGNSWDNDDAIGVYVTSTDGVTIYGENVQYTTTSTDGATLGNFTSTSPIYPPSSGNVEIFSYYPYEDGVNLESYPIDSKAENQVDLLSAKVTEAINPASPSVNLTFNHKLSKISLTIVAEGGITLAELEDVGVTISNVSTSGTFNLENGTVNDDLSEKVNLSLKTTTTKEDNTVKAVSSSAIVIPQNLESDTQTLTFTTTDGSVFTAELTTTEFEVGMQYEYTATINDNRVDITTTGINEWLGSDNDPTVGNASLADITYKDNIYYISSAKGLAAFRDLVNGATSNTEGATIVNIAADYFNGSTKPSINGKLMKEIDLSEICGTAKSWTPIGNTSDAAYTGKFDGDGHKVSGLYIGTGSKLGLFGYLGTDGLICNVGVAGDIETESIEIAGIVAWNKGWVMNCYSEVNLNKDNDSPGNNVGGIAGLNEGNVVNCYNTGYVKGQNNVGGIVGQNTAGGYVGYSFSVGDIVGTGLRFGGIVGWNYETTDEAPTIKGCFCLDNTTYSIGQLGYTVASGSYDGNMYDADYFKSDVFVYLMNNGAATYNKNEDDVHDDAPIGAFACAWVDNTKTSEYPTLNFGETLEYNEDVYDIIYNSGTYEINTAKGLKAFAALVNNGGISTEDGYLTSGNFDIYFKETTARTSINGKLMDDITLTDVSWTPIGEGTTTYSGTFDGNGKLVSGLNVPSAGAAGLFGIISGTISNLGVTGGTVSGTSAGGVVGKNSGGTVINCYNAGCTVTGNSHIGGVVGYVDSGGVVVNCYNAG